jgi:CheY-like chemotaxis protein
MPPSGRVLLIEDDEPVAATMSEILLDLGYETHIASSADQGLVRMPAVRPDVVLLDLTMPGMSGFEALSLLRQRHPAVPVIVVTSNVEPEVAQRVLDAGAFAHVLKPFDMVSLDRSVRSALLSRDA